MILATMATMSSRAPYIEEAIETIHPQVDAVRIYLNNFDEIPAFFSREEVVLSQDAAGDLGAEGNFIGLMTKWNMTITYLSMMTFITLLTMFKPSDRSLKYLGNRL